MEFLDILKGEIHNIINPIEIKELLEFGVKEFIKFKSDPHKAIELIKNFKYKSKYHNNTSSDYKYYESHGTHSPIIMPSIYSKKQCAGTYHVNGYTRDDGTKVSDYYRTCGAKHLNQR